MSQAYHSDIGGGVGGGVSDFFAASNGNYLTQSSCHSLTFGSTRFLLRTFIHFS